MNPQGALQQAAQNFLAQNPNAVHIPPGQFVAAVHAPVQQARQPLIAAELQNFMNVYPNGAAVTNNFAAAQAAFTQHMANVGIIYQQQALSKQNNMGVDGFHIGELLDMLYTLTNYAPPAFQANRFYQKLVTMHGIMSQTDSDSDSDSD